MKKLSLLAASLLSGALILTACSTKEETKQTNSSDSSSQKTEEKKVVQAYDFTAMDKDGKEVKLSDFKGKKVYINVWASWCGPCIREIPELEKAYQKLKTREDIVFLSMTSPNDEVFKNQNPADKSKQVILDKANELGMTYPVLFDVNDRFMINYSIRSFPTHVFVNSDGTIENRVIGSLTEETLNKELEKLK